MTDGEKMVYAMAFVTELDARLDEPPPWADDGGESWERTAAIDAAEAALRYVYLLRSAHSQMKTSPFRDNEEAVRALEEMLGKPPT